MILFETKRITDYINYLSTFKLCQQFIAFRTPILTSVEAQSQSSVMVYWNRSDFGGMAANINNYMVLWLPDDGAGFAIASPDSTNALISNLTSNTNYSFQMTIQGSNGLESASSIELFEATCKISFIHCISKKFIIFQPIFSS